MLTNILKHLSSTKKNYVEKLNFQSFKMLNAQCLRLKFLLNFLTSVFILKPKLITYIFFLLCFSYFAIYTKFTISLTFFFSLIFFLVSFSLLTYFSQPNIPILSFLIILFTHIIIATYINNIVQNDCN